MKVTAPGVMLADSPVAEVPLMVTVSVPLPLKSMAVVPAGIVSFVPLSFTTQLARVGPPVKEKLPLAVVAETTKIPVPPLPALVGWAA